MHGHFRAALAGCAAAAFAAVGASAAERAVAVSNPEKAAVVHEDAAAIGRVHQGSGRYCTGTLVAKNVVVTAAHCLIDPRSKRWIRAESLHFLGGYRIGEYDYHARVERYTVSPAYNPKKPLQSLEADWAMLSLTDTPEEGAPIRLQAVDAREAVGEVTGYATRRKYALSTSEPCKVERVGFLLVGRCQGLPGMSGAPLIDVDTGEMLGFQVAAGNREGRDLMVAVPAGNWKSALASAR